MDLVGACQAFVHVSERGSFTLGAAAARVPQPVASRRIAALERHWGARLFDRSTRRATLTPFGREMLPSARRLVRLAETVELDAQRARLTPLRLAVPEVCSTLRLARLDAEARREGIHLDLRTAPPNERAELVRSADVGAALVAVPTDEAAWRVPLGVAGAAPSARVVYLESLRRGRAEAAASPRRVWLQPEDDVPHVRDRLTGLRDAVGLSPVQVSAAATLPAAMAEVLESDDLLLASPGQAEELGLDWSPLGELDLERGYDVATNGGEDPQRLRTGLRRGVARCLGASEEGEPA
ncbi:DNA-binding transcriptional LysR family regulator [Haloactinospora alba]|uniref:DNA-binding transcriptional LysR family regulator n=1 Tax=Haloactinospora alba TaxID=405555 RepID=A0A543N9F3_9ACTN|nr:LysR family transcriptional regulator [Haloactinospora alba]TQN28440.1 DNA-binding transcriptional LysR family regulator [Haloactinospora alba]